MTREQSEAKLAQLASEEVNWREFLDFVTRKPKKNDSKFFLSRDDLAEEKIGKWSFHVNSSLKNHLETHARSRLKDISEERIVIETTLAMKVADDDIGGVTCGA